MEAMSSHELGLGNNVLEPNTNSTAIDLSAAENSNDDRTTNCTSFPIGIRVENVSSLRRGQHVVIRKPKGKHLYEHHAIVKEIY